VAQGEGHEFKPQYNQKQKERRKEKMVQPSVGGSRLEGSQFEASPDKQLVRPHLQSNQSKMLKVWLKW
jgi:hypothetical protein